MGAVQYTQFGILKMLLNAQEEKEIVHNCAFAARNLGADAKCIADNNYAVEKCALRCT